MNTTLGVILIELGLFGLAWMVPYATRQKLADTGRTHASRDITNNMPAPPIAGAAALMGRHDARGSAREGIISAQPAASYRSEEREIDNVDTNYYFGASFGWRWGLLRP